ncbi:MAG: hypothetical protein Q4F31_09075 [Eubacteriales bacterium]|nr:hypothetical protein [Eubacteriales bacterium]
MKNKAVLSLIEQVIMVLVFAVAAAICLRVFMHADSISQDSSYTDSAFVMAQNTAEMIKNSCGELLLEEGTYFLKENDLVLKAELSETDNQYLGAAEITVYREDEILCEIPVRWQK